MQNTQEIAQKAAEVNIWFQVAQFAIPSLVTIGVGWWLSLKTETYKRDLLKDLEDYKKELSKELETHKHSLQETAESKKIRREKIEEVHHLMTLYSLEIHDNSRRLLKVPKGELAEYHQLSDLLIHPLAKIDTILMLHIPELRPDFNDFVDLANSLEQASIEYITGKHNFDIIINRRDLLQKACRSLIIKIQKFSYKETGVILPDNQTPEA